MEKMTDFEKNNCGWALRVIQSALPEAKWVRILKSGTQSITIAARRKFRSHSDTEVNDIVDFLRSLHPAIMDAWLSHANADGETYEIRFSRPLQLSMF